MGGNMSEFEQVVDYLPQSMIEMVDIIGMPATEKLVRKLGGGSFWLAGESTRYFEKVKNVVGEDLANQLLHHYGRDEIYIPRCDKALKVLRNQRFYAAFCEMQSRNISGRMAMVELCPQFDITWRTGWEIVRQAKIKEQQSSQATLF